MRGFLRWYGWASLCLLGVTLATCSVSGYGPDVTSYQSPITSTFRILVSFTDDHLSATPATTATVRVYEYGVEKAELTRALQKQGDVWQAADVDWPSGTITPIP